MLAVALRLSVRCFGSTTVALSPEPQISLLKTREPLPVHALQPMVQPLENQKPEVGLLETFPEIKLVLGG